MSLSCGEARRLKAYLSAYPDDLPAVYAASGAEPVSDEALQLSFDRLSLVKLSRALSRCQSTHSPRSLATIAARRLAHSDDDSTRLHFARLALDLGDKDNAYYWSLRDVRPMADSAFTCTSNDERLTGNLIAIAAKASHQLGNISEAILLYYLYHSININNVDFSALKSLLCENSQKLYPGSWQAMGHLAKQSVALRSIMPDMVKDTEDGELVSADDATAYNDYWRTAVLSRGRFRIDMSSGASAPVAIRHQLQRLRPKQHFSGTTLLVHNTHGAAQFYHWMIQILPRLGIALRSGVEFDHLALYDTQKQYVRDAITRLGISNKKLIDLREIECFSADRIIVPPVKWLINSALIDFVRRTYLPEKSCAEAGPPLYISRRQAKSRRIVNEEELLSTLSREFGFVSVQFENLSLAEQACAMESAPCVVAPHGAGLSNICFCRPGALIVEIMPTDYNRCYSDLSRTAGLNYAHFNAPFINDRKDILVDVGLLKSYLSTAGLK